MKKHLLLMSFMLAISISGCGNNEPSQNAVSQETTASQRQETNQDKITLEDELSQDTNQIEIQETITGQEENTSSETISNEETEVNLATPEVEHRTGEEIIGISNKDISELSPIFHANVRNDKTGNWRLATISENVDIQEYILSYYQTYFKDDSELHFIVNMTRKITTRISCIGDMLYISQYDYLDDEEHDAILLGSGTHLGQSRIYMDNGDIEKIE